MTIRGEKFWENYYSILSFTTYEVVKYLKMCTQCSRKVSLRRDRYYLNIDFMMRKRVVIPNLERFVYACKMCVYINKYLL